MTRKRIGEFAASLAVTAMLGGGAFAQTVTGTHLSVVGAWGSLSQYKNLMK